MYEELALISLDEDVDIELVILTDEDIENEIRRQIAIMNKPIYMTELIYRVRCALRAKGYSVSEDRIRRVIKELGQRENIPLIQH